jgi:catechol 2,3-dioxygenase-like lactoylglutathione lyase family enzyme
MAKSGYAGAMRMATIGVTDLDKAMLLFHDIMELKVEREGHLSGSLLQAWGLGAGVSGRFVELSCKGYPLGWLRLVQYQPQATQKVRLDSGGDSADSGTDVGAKAIDFYVEDPIAPYVEKIEHAGYEFRSPPVKHQIGNTVSEECLFSGPDGVPVLIMVGHFHAETSMRSGSPDGPFSEIPTISVVAGDLDETRRFYKEGLGLVAVADDETGDEYRNKVDDLTGVPHGTRVHFLLWADEGEASGKILCVHFFDRTGKRLTDRMKPGKLGFSLLTHDTDDLDALHERLGSMGYEIVQPPVDIKGDGDPYRMMMVRGPNEEMFEFTQR